MTPASQDAYVKAWQDAGYSVDYRKCEGRDRVGLGKPQSPLVPQLLVSA